MSKESEFGQRTTTTLQTNVSMDDKFKKLDYTNIEEDDKIFGTNPNKVSGSMAAIIRSLKKTTDMLEKEICDLQSSLENQNKILVFT